MRLGGCLLAQIERQYGCVPEYIRQEEERRQNEQKEENKYYHEGDFRCFEEENSCDDVSPNYCPEENQGDYFEKHTCDNLNKEGCQTRGLDCANCDWLPF